MTMIKFKQRKVSCIFLLVFVFILTGTHPLQTSDEDLRHLFCQEDENCGDKPQPNSFLYRMRLHESKSEFHPCKTFKTCTCSWYSYILRGVIVKCSSKSLQQIPESLPKYMVSLYLNNNSITKISDKAFTRYSRLVFLDLSYNKIQALNKDSFAGLESVQILLLNKNKIWYNNNSIHPDTFAPLVKLTDLQLQQNLHSLSKDESYPGEALEKLQSLHCLSLDGLPDQVFPKSFSKLQKLYKVVLNGFNGRCFVPKLTSNMLNSLKSITHLQIKNCQLTDVEDRSFASLTNLKQLDLSFNELLEFRNLRNITAGLNETQIISLCLNKIHRTFGGCTSLSAIDMEFMALTNMTYLSLDSNRFSILDKEAVQFIPKSLIGISLEDNKLLIADYIIEVFRQMKKIFSNLEVLILSKQHLTHDFSKLYLDFNSPGKHVIEPENIILRQKIVQNNELKTQKVLVDKWQLNETSVYLKDHDSNITLKAHAKNAAKHDNLTSVCENCNAIKAPVKLILPPKLQVLDLSDQVLKMYLRKLCFCEPNNLKVLKFSRNFLWQWIGPAGGMTNLTELDMSGNYCQNMSYDTLHGMPNLRIFNATRNLLSFSLSRDYNGETFKNQYKLLSLDLSDNKLRYVPNKLFDGLVNLVNLSLNNNQLTQASFNVEKMINITNVYLRNNFLEQIGTNIRQHFDKIATSNNLSVDLSFNRFKCDCYNLDFIQWLGRTQVNLLNKELYLCKFENETIGNLTFSDHIYESLKAECTSYFTILMSTISALIVLILLVLCSIVYRYRWHLRYMYYSAKIRSRRYLPLNTENQQYEHDAFVSYSDSEGCFVRRCLVPELEEKRGIRLMVHDRDFRPGEFVTDNIMHAITSSRKTLMILSNSFLKSNWCCYEMNMARMEGIKTGRSVLCILMKEEVEFTGLPLEVIEVIEEQTYAHIPDDPDEVQELWDKLKISLLE